MISGESIILLAHGSPDPRHRVGVGELAAAVQARTPTEVRIAYLAHHGPTPVQARGALRGGVVVPVLLTRAHHARDDVPGVLESLGEGFRATDPLGPEPRLAFAIGELLDRAGRVPDPELAVINYVPGSSDRAAVSAVGAALARGIPGANWGPWLVAALAGGDPLSDVVERLGARAAVVVSYMIAEGVLRDRMVERCAAVGVEMIDGTLGQTSTLADLVLARANSVRTAV